MYLRIPKMAVSSTSSLLLYAAAGFSAFTVAAHTKMGFDTVLPSIRKFNPTDPGLVAAKIGWMELNQGFVLMCMSILSQLYLPLNHRNDHVKRLVLEGNHQWGFLYPRHDTENQERERNEAG